jgi:hypothetical protein
MSAVCLPGLQGFPVQISGWNSLTEKSQLIMPNDIHLQFSPSESPMRYFPENGGTLSINGANSFFIAGNQYEVYSVRLTKPNQEGLQSFSGTAVAEFQIWGQKKSAENEIAVLVIPIYTKTIDSRSGAALLRVIKGDPARLIDCIPSDWELAAQWPSTPPPGTPPDMVPAAQWPSTPPPKTIEIVRYKTCVETDSNTTPMIFIEVAYWSTGSYVRQIDFAKMIPILPPAGVPLKNNIKLLTSFIQLSDENLTKADRKYEVISHGTTSIPYKKAVNLSATSKEFQNAFRIIKNFTKENEDSEPRWIPINTETDIIDGRLLIDLNTGKRLSADEVEANLKKTEVNAQPVNINRGLVIFLKILGVFLGITFLMFLVRIFQRFVSSSSTPISIELPIETISKS